MKLTRRRGFPKVILLRDTQAAIDAHTPVENEFLFNTDKGHAQIFKNGQWIDLPEIDRCQLGLYNDESGFGHQVLEQIDE